MPSDGAAASTERMKNLEQGLALWQNLPEDQKRGMLARFDQMFGLTQHEKEKVLKTLSESDREQIEKTLRKFGALSAAQRSECIRSFEKFTNLSVEERNQFLRNAERWKVMSPEERQQWKEVVQRLTPQPPLPPGLGQPPPPPYGFPPRRPAPLATNGN
jgi:DNA-binding MarR family transcriptional regulator